MAVFDMQSFPVRGRLLIAFPNEPIQVVNKDLMPVPYLVRQQLAVFDPLTDRTLRNAQHFAHFPKREELLSDFGSDSSVRFIHMGLPYVYCCLNQSSMTVRTWRKKLEIML
jgi:hypothetical protein